MMVVNGGTLPDVFNYPVWSETVSVVPGARYVFTGWTCTADASDSSPSRLAAWINGQTMMASFTVPSTGADWGQFTFAWTDVGSPTATISLFDINADAIGNDFVLDDLSFSRMSPVPEPTPFAVLGLGLAALLRRRTRRPL